MSNDASVVNVSIGILGHVDSGKTSLARRLSSVASTAAFDKHPQSQERGITLDLGFSSFQTKPPPHWKNIVAKQLQVTLVDCPGHASLVRTVIGGAQIIDSVLLVVDVTKGIQTQTAECLVLVQIIQRPLVIALNKIDLLPAETRAAKIDRMTAALRKTVASLGYPNVPVVPVSATSEATADAITPDDSISGLMHAMCASLPEPAPSDDAAQFLCAIDHCFGIKGKGTILTGTVLSGRVQVGDTIEIVHCREQRRVKSMQRFRTSIQSAAKGDRVGICITQFDPERLERGLVATPDTVKLARAVIVDANRIAFHKQPCCTRTKFHVTVGYETVTAKATFFASTDASQRVFSEELLYEHRDALETADGTPLAQWALLEFDRPIACTDRALVIAARLDADIQTKQCRLAYYGHVVRLFESPDYRTALLPRIRVYKTRTRTALVDRVIDDYTLIGRNLVARNASIEKFIGMRIKCADCVGQIESSFGQSGKFRVVFSSKLAEHLRAGTTSNRKSRTAAAATAPSNQLELHFMKFVFDPEKRMHQE